MSEAVFRKAPNFRPAEADTQTETVPQWFVSIDGELYGPLLTEQVSGLVHSRELLVLDLVWREGMDDWAELRDIPEFEGLVDRTEPTLKTVPAAAPDDLLEELQELDEKDIEQYETETDSDTESGSATTAPGTDTSSDDRPPGEAYSLANLLDAASLETPDDPGARDPTPAGHAHDEGSGLIDLGMVSTGTEESAPDNADDEISQQLRPPGMADTKQRFDSLAPMELTSRMASPQNRPLLMAVMGGVGLISAAAAVVAVIIDQEQPEQSLQTAAATAMEVSPAQIPDEIEGPPAAETAPPEDPPEPEIVEVEPTPEPEPVVEEAPEPEEPIAAVIPEVTKKRTGRARRPREARKLSAVRKRAGSSRSGARARLRSQPSRKQVLAAMRRVAPSVKACAKGSRGTAMAKISIKGSSGKVTRVSVKGVKPAAARCMTRVIGRARFPRFQKDRFDIKFPFRL
jgi:outer membrane biosynthesis protein TonB